MQDVRFEAFGEPIDYKASSAPEGRASKSLMRAGSTVFWSVVAAIVVARAVYFAPDLTEKFWQLEALGRSALTVFGV
jgi:hypothetical protein